MPEGHAGAAVHVADRAARPRRQGRCATAAPARSTSSSRRCTGRTRWPSPTTLFARVEDVLGLPRNTLKMGIMDEERRTTVNLKACIRAAQRSRGLHQHRLPRPHRRRDPHLDGGRPDDPQGRHARRRLDQGLRGPERRYRPGLRPARPGADRQGHVGGARPDGRRCWSRRSATRKAGANTAWVPSPTAATLHALHYHQVDVRAAAGGAGDARPRAKLDDILTIPLADRPNWPPDEVQQELDNNCPGHPRLRRALDRPGRRLLEGARHPRRRPDGGPRDAAHLQPAHRQLAAPRRRHQEQVEETMQRMAAVVDRQNAGDSAYAPMAPGFDGPAFQAACDLVFKGARSRTATPSPSCTRAAARRRRAADRRAARRRLPPPDVAPWR